jgi:phenylpropionate dioxygenase-like ring-hydroxylating dioxygenase large terminal subunit
MAIASGYWIPVAASSEVGHKPVGLTRLGKRLVFWRDGQQMVCMPDRCPHRGAALSLGRVNQAQGTLGCPFHGLEFDADGRCARIPVERDQSLCADLRVTTFEVCEANGYIWLWEGEPHETRPPPPAHPALAGLRYGESTSVWPAHYTRCIENVCDYSHLPYVHRWTIGGLKRDPLTNIEIEDVPGGFRAYLLEAGKRSQCLEFLYPNLWLLMISPAMMLSAVFSPIDAERTCVYGRTYYRTGFPGSGPVMNLWTWISQLIVFREDWPVVASQSPGDIADAQHEKLLPSDAPVIAYRKLHSRYKSPRIEA